MDQIQGSRPMKITPRAKAEFERTAGYGIRLESITAAADGETLFKFFVATLNRSMTIGCRDAGTPAKVEREAARIGAYASQWADRRIQERAGGVANVNG